MYWLQTTIGRKEIDHITDQSSNFHLHTLWLVYVIHLDHTGNIQAIVHFMPDMVKHNFSYWSQRILYVHLLFVRCCAKRYMKTLDRLCRTLWHGVLEMVPRLHYIIPCDFFRERYAKDCLYASFVFLPYQIMSSLV